MTVRFVAMDDGVPLRARSAGRAPRCILLAGTSGSGKTTLCRLGHAAMQSAWGHPAAAIDLDTLYQAIDPLWELEYSDARNAMVMEQAVAWTRSLVAHGWRTVILTGNSIFDPHDTAPVVAALGHDLAVHHVTLLVREDVILARCAGQPDRDPAHLVADLRPASRLQHPGTALLDSSDLDPHATLEALVRLVVSGAGLLARDS
jgi:energy-coupling factor transporter ATP-binding protein EcfA2